MCAPTRDAAEATRCAADLAWIGDQIEDEVAGGLDQVRVETATARRSRTERHVLAKRFCDGPPTTLTGVAGPVRPIDHVSHPGVATGRPSLPARPWR